MIMSGILFCGCKRKQSWSESAHRGTRHAAGWLLRALLSKETLWLGIRLNSESPIFRGTTLSLQGWEAHCGRPEGRGCSRRGSPPAQRLTYTALRGIIGNTPSPLTHHLKKALNSSLGLQVSHMAQDTDKAICSSQSRVRHT